ncbi:MAG: pilin [Patescibacteria group bacterium]|nr:pilin [Patescibacteria group bacterium]
MKKNNSYLLILLVFFVFLFSFNLIFAQGFKFNFPGATAGTSSIQAYIVNFYQFGLAIAGILAVGMIVAGAIYYSLSGASPDKQSEAKDMITSAIWGLILLFGSYLILSTINPNLVVLDLPGQGSTSCSAKNAPKPCETNETPIYNQSNGTCNCYIPLQTNCSFQPELPSCTPGQSATDDKGNCVCKPEKTETASCPGDFAPLAPDPNNIPVYAWTTDVNIIKALKPNRLPIDPSAWPYFSRCPRKVKIKISGSGTDFYTIDCDSCEGGWSQANDGHHITTSTDWTTGWLWPYYPKKLDLSKALCLMYAWYNPEESALEKADLDGLKACTTFSTSTLVNIPVLKDVKPCLACVDFPFQVDTRTNPFSPIPSPVMIPSKPIGEVCNPSLTSLDKCMVTPGIKTKLTKLYNQTKNWNETGRQNEGDAWNQKNLSWEVTEVWPPAAAHQDPCHYNGTCIDVALRENVNCNNVAVFKNLAQNAGGFWVKNEYPDCGGATTPNWTGGHFHLK